MTLKITDNQYSRLCQQQLGVFVNYRPVRVNLYLIIGESLYRA